MSESAPQFNYEPEQFDISAMEQRAQQAHRNLETELKATRAAEKAARNQAIQAHQDELESTWIDQLQGKTEEQAFKSHKGIAQRLKAAQALDDYMQSRPANDTETLVQSVETAHDASQAKEDAGKTTDVIYNPGVGQAVSDYKSAVNSGDKNAKQAAIDYLHQTADKESDDERRALLKAKHESILNSIDRNASRQEFFARPAGTEAEPQPAPETKTQEAPKQEAPETEATQEPVHEEEVDPAFSPKSEQTQVSKVEETPATEETETTTQDKEWTVKQATAESIRAAKETSEDSDSSSETSESTDDSEQDTSESEDSHDDQDDEDDHESHGAETPRSRRDKLVDKVDKLGRFLGLLDFKGRKTRKAERSEWAHEDELTLSKLFSLEDDDVEQSSDGSVVRTPASVHKTVTELSEALKKPEAPQKESPSPKPKYGAAWAHAAGLMGVRQAFSDSETHDIGYVGAHDLLATAEGREPSVQNASHFAEIADQEAERAKKRKTQAARSGARNPRVA